MSGSSRGRAPRSAWKLALCGSASGLALAMAAPQADAQLAAETASLDLAAGKPDASKRRASPPVISVGDYVLNPVSYASERVVEVLGNRIVLTDSGNFILLVEAVDDTFTDNDSGITWRVTAVRRGGLLNRVVSVDIVNTNDKKDTRTGLATVFDRSTAIGLAGAAGPNGAGGSGASGGGLGFGLNDVHPFSRTSYGADGSDGSDGGGVRVCVPILGCATIGKSPSAGGAGADGGDLTVTVTTANNGDISIESNDRSGVTVISAGGDGGQGGDGYGIAIPGAPGGRAGAGGDINLTADVNIVTTGRNSHGIDALSRSGRGGDGGSGYIASGGGGGGTAGQGGAVTVDSNGTITTSGSGSIGIFAQSRGGAAGGGGDSFGFVAGGGGGSAGGNGGNVSVNNSGRITTSGADAYGILAQSVGGSGGNAGTAGGIAAFGDSGGVGGSAGSATVTTESTSVITTTGIGAHAIFAQSVGGGGGSGGTSIGLVGLGSAGSAGGNGSTVVVDNAGSLSTTGVRARGIFAQSVGGGGGAGGTGGGLVSIGGSGGNASEGGTVRVTNTGLINTTGNLSSGIQAQSIGGGGGDGGTSGGVFLTIGGRGGGGGRSGPVTVTHGGVIGTTGADSHGIFIQSVGGGGGNAGGAASLSAFAGVAIGGAGGSGGNGGLVDLNFNQRLVSGQPADAVITTTGARSYGVYAQSVGGGGGNGGFAAQLTGGYGGAVSVAIGGSGGSGGRGGLVDVDGRVDITTGGQNAIGMFAQSVGGGGGTGGFAISVAAAGGPVGGSVSVGIGGSGGSGGVGGQVDVRSGGRIQTGGEFATGLLTQSVGGGGGAGGFSVSASGAGAGGLAGSVSVGVGGSGGSGGVGGLVHSTFAGDILTTGDDAAGAIIQSVGGGGGNGGFTVSAAVAASGTASVAAAVGVGGSGGNGGAGGAVTAVITGDVTTRGEDSDAILVQSAGGGGGNGGFSIAGSVAASGSGGSLAASVGVGGAGGDGGNASSASLTFTGAARTLKDGSDGVIVQSTGGGGGNGGFSIAGGISGSASGLAGAVSVGVGGSGGGGGNAGNVSLIQNSGLADPNNTLLAASTFGDRARGLLVQSVGGGGGNGGFNISGGISASRSGAGNIMVGVGGSGGSGGSGGNSSLSVRGDVLTNGDDSGAVLVQSVGGGGGNGGFNISGGLAASTSAAGNLVVGVGGTGGGGGQAGNASAAFLGDIGTMGHRSVGFAVQSQGGSGGNGGFNISGGLSLASSGGAGTIGVGVGGFGGGGGNAGTVSATHTGTVHTMGNDATGALIQSVGGGGGNGAVNVTGTITLGRTGAGSVGFGLGGFGGGGGTGNTVSAAINGDYRTEGDQARAIIAQSIGGSGGAGGVNITGSVSLSTGLSGTGAIGLGGFGGSGGNANTVDLFYAGNVETDGANSDGILVQSIGGGGGAGGVNVSGGLSISTRGNAGSVGFGLGGFGGAGGNAGNVSATVLGSVHARGLGRDVTTPRRVIPFDLQVLGLSFDFVIPADRERSDGSHGVLVQSVGGSGGAGGVNVTGQISVSQSGSPAVASRALSVGIGGFGGDGGNAGTASLVLNSGDPAMRSQIQAVGDDRNAVTVQSLGGGGGVGGLNVTGGFAMAGTLSVGIGGFGGQGGIGRDVTVDLDADLFASGDNSRGLLAQSVGGGGGHGGINISGAISATGGGSEAALAFGLGGSGGAGTRSGNVTVDQSGSILVDGRRSVGLLAQSVAGGGGSGAFNATAAANFAPNSGRSNPLRGFGLGIGIGGTGGTGADAGNVDVESHGDIIINGRFRTNPAPGTDPLQAVEFTGDSVGLLAQSLGGGGGVGGLNIAGAIAPTGNPVVVGIGGTGGSGGDAGTVDVVRGTSTTPAGLIRTFGGNSDGLVAQSIGGGGGMAGMNFVFAATGGNGSPMGNSTSAIINVGGSGSGAGDGDDVSVRHFGNIVTDGDNSDGLFAQSLGGGGGSATFNVGLGLIRNSNSLNLTVGGDVGTGGAGGNVDVEHDGTIVTSGNNANGIMAMSTGGGGGSTMLDEIFNEFSNHSIDITIGRRGGTGGRSGNVDVDASGRIDTSGSNAHGIFAQSTGGGGGNSSASSIGATRSGNGNRNDYSAEIAVGLEGGIAAVGGDVDVENAAIIVTRGAGSHGIFAQTTGGGGGAGGAVANLVVDANSTFSILNGGLGGTGAIGGDIHVDNTGGILTQGDNSEGIRALATGGGGGVGGLVATLGYQAGGASGSSGPTSLEVRVGGRGGQGAEGGEVDVSNSAVIQTQGSSSYGIRAQSVGGGGGIGGAVFNARMQRQGGSRNMDINVGGAGNLGGSGDRVEVLNTGTIFTEGEDAIGIVATSIGGGGGSGGAVLNALAGNAGSQAQTVQLGINVGGAGGRGGSGGTVTVTNRLALDPVTGAAIADTGRIITRKDRAHGIMAQSIGGGGGNGGVVLSATAMNSSEDSFLASFSFGGSGGDGETGGHVTVTNGGLIDTSGDDAHGILAQSVGGGGGNGAMVANLNAAFGAPSRSPVLAIGGVGGNGGDGGRVDVTNTGTIIVRGDDSNGIHAQSIGGGGGNASLAFGLSGEPASMLLSNAIAIAVGNNGGGAGGTGGEVNVTNSGDIYALGARSQAILAQSINGGGGTVGVNFNGLVGFETIPVVGPGSNPNVTQPTVQMASGSTSASDMNAGRVTVTNNGRIFTSGEHATAGLVQSIGGGGGSSDLVINLTSNLNQPNRTAQRGSNTLGAASMRAVNFDLSLGGQDGLRNAGARIASSNTGEVSVTGLNSHGAVIQSVGDGGGRILADITAPAGTSIGQVALSLGGERGTDGAAGEIVYRQTGAMMTDGELASAGIVQSIGGGGGFAGLFLSGGGASSAQLAARLGAVASSGADAGRVDAEISGGLATLGENSAAMILQSIGAGGGDLRLGTDVTPVIALGGSGGAEGDGGDVSLFNTGVVYTEGARSHGLILQSIGGGGGTVFGAGAGVQVNLSSGNRGDGGDISLRQVGSIITAGESTRGVIVQSLGGGGGWVERGHAGTAGGAGMGGNINLRFDGNIAGMGANSVGVFAQSVGREGSGDIGMVVDGSIVMTGADSTGVHAVSETRTGRAGAISLDVTGMIEAGGANSSALVLRSAATGPGGFGGRIDLDIAGSVLGTEAGSTAVTLQSLGAAGGGDITAVLRGAVRGGDGAGRGVFIDGGASNTITTMTSLSAVSGLAIAATTGDDTVINQGLVVGNVDLGSGSNRFDNQAGATFIAFDTIDMRDPAPAESGIPGKMPTRMVQETADVPVSEPGSEPAASTDDIKAPASLIQDVTVSQAPADKTPSAPVQDTNLTPAPGAMFGETPVTVVSVDAMQPEAAQVSLPVNADPTSVAQIDDEADETLDGADVAYQMASQLRHPDRTPVRLVQDVPPARLGAPIADATFSNSGTFNMGLAASRLPIDLLNGDTFGNFDHLATPQTNILFGARVINTVALDGNFEQTASGHMAFDVAYGPYVSDRVDVTGDAAFAGTGEVILTWLQDDIAVPLFQVAGTTTDNGLEIADTMAVDFSVAAESDGLYLNIATDFGGISTLNRNDRALGGHMDSAVQVDRSAGIGRLLAFLGNMQAGQEDVYAAVFRELNPEAHVSVMQSQLNIANTTAHDLFRCGAEGSGLDDQCVWSRIEMNVSDRETSFEAFSVDRSGARFAGGVEQPLGQDWSAAVAIAFEQSGRILVDEDRARLETQSVSAALGLQRDIDRGFTLGASLSGGWSWGDSLRQVTVFQPGVGEAEFQTGYLRMEGQVARQFGGHEGGLFVTPSLTVSGTALRHAGLAERGLDGLGITVQADTQYVGAVAPALTFGHIWQNPDENKQLVTSLSVGTRLNSTDRVDLPMRFVGANPASDAAMIGTLLEDVTTVSAGIQFIETDRVSVDFGVDAEFGEETQRQRAGVDIRLRF